MTNSTTLTNPAEVSDQPQRLAYVNRPYDERSVRDAISGNPDFISPADRYQAIRRLIQHGVGDARIAVTLRCSPRTVRRVRATAVNR